MTQTKPWWASRAIIGGIVSVAAGVLGLSQADVAEITDLLMGLGPIVGGALSIYGRWKAKRAIAI